jgi:hypothetical protein
VYTPFQSTLPLLGIILNWILGQMWWFTSIIPATQEAEASQNKVFKTLAQQQQNTKQKNWICGSGGRVLAYHA